METERRKIREIDRLNLRLSRKIIVGIDRLIKLQEKLITLNLLIIFASISPVFAPVLKDLVVAYRLEIFPIVTTLTQPKSTK
jgi:VIT1/CCC1 family predicted Fe2+/Mn2+ transporter